MIQINKTKNGWCDGPLFSSQSMHLVSVVIPISKASVTDCPSCKMRRAMPQHVLAWWRTRKQLARSTAARGRPEGFLASRVPYLELDGLVVNCNAPRPKLHPYRGRSVCYASVPACLPACKQPPLACDGGAAEYAKPRSERCPGGACRQYEAHSCPPASCPLARHAHP